MYSGTVIFLWHMTQMAYLGWELQSVSVDDVFSWALRGMNSRLKRGEETLTTQGGSMTGN